MGNEQQIRAAALVLLVAVAVISYLHWGRGIEGRQSTTPTPDQPATTGGAVTGSGGGGAGTSSPSGVAQPSASPPVGLPPGGGFKEGEQGEKGEENQSPDGEAVPTTLWGEEGGTSSPDGQTGSQEVQCLKKAKTETDRGYNVSGKLVRAPGTPKTVTEILLIATKQPIDEWKAKKPVEVFWVGAASGDAFDVVFEAGEGPIHLCGVGPTAHKDVQLIQAAGCLSNPLQAAPGGQLQRTELELVLKPLEEKILLVGAASLAQGNELGSRVRRTVTGKVQATGVKAGEFFVMAAAAPILDNQESLADPAAFSFVGPDGQFKLSLFSETTEALFVCAMALPQGKVKGSPSIEGQGCMRLQMPEAPSADGGYDVVGTMLGVNPEKMPLAPHEMQHLEQLKRCGTTGT